MKIWAAGVADEQWKLEVCVRDAKQAADVLQFLGYVTGAKLQELSGSQIASALKAYAESAAKSAQNAGHPIPIEISDALKRINDSARQE